MPTIRAAALLLWVVPALTSGLPAQANRFERLLQPRVEDLMRRQGIPGIALGIVENGTLTYARGFGVRSLRETTAPVTTRSLFHMASVTKPFVATAVMQLVEEGRVELDARVGTYLPYFRLDDDRSAAITVRQLLSHTSGMPDEQDYEWDKPQVDDGALERYVRGLAHRRLVAEPGTTYRYSNPAYEVLGDLVAKVSGVPFEDYVATRILRPLGMAKSTLFLPTADSALLVRPHVLDGDYNVSVSAVFPYNRAHAPSSTLYSSVVDMSRWAMATLNRGAVGGTRILARSAYDTMWTPAGVEWPQAGLGWFLGEHRGHRTVGHSGRDVGFTSNLVLLPERRLAVVVLANYDRAALQPLTALALDVALGLPPEPLAGVAGHHLDQILFHTILREGVAAAVQQYETLKREPPGFDFNQVRQLNRLGYHLLDRRRAEEAVAIFRLNVDAYPSFAFLHDRLAEGYLALGDTAQSVAHYRKALELDPNSRTAAAMLRKLGAAGN